MPMELYTPEEAAARLKLARRTVYRWIRQGKIKGVKLGNHWRVTEEEMNRLLTQGTGSQNHTGGRKPAGA